MALEDGDNISFPLTKIRHVCKQPPYKIVGILNSGVLSCHTKLPSIDGLFHSIHLALGGQEELTETCSSCCLLRHEWDSLLRLIQESHVSSKISETCSFASRIKGKISDTSQFLIINIKFLSIMSPLLQIQYKLYMKSHKHLCIHIFVYFFFI